MKPELFYLGLVTVLTGLLWLPYILDRIMVQGLTDAVSYPANPKPQSPWAQRLMKAHANAVENLVVFATLVLLAHALTGKRDDATQQAERIVKKKLGVPLTRRWAQRVLDGSFFS